MLLLIFILIIFYGIYCKSRNKNTSLGAESLTEVSLKRTLGRKVLDVATIVSDLAFGTSINELLTGQLGETPVLGDNDLLLTRELVLATSESLNDNMLVVVLGADGEDDLTNVDTGNETVGLTESTTHTGLQSKDKGYEHKMYKFNNH